MALVRRTKAGRFNELVASAFRVAASAIETASAHIPVLIGHGLRVTVWADQSEVIEIVIERITILVIEFERRSAAHPLSYAAHFAAVASRFK